MYPFKSSSVTVYDKMSWRSSTGSEKMLTRFLATMAGCLELEVVVTVRGNLEVVFLLQPLTFAQKFPVWLCDKLDFV